MDSSCTSCAFCAFCAEGSTRLAAADIDIHAANTTQNSRLQEPRIQEMSLVIFCVPR